MFIDWNDTWCWGEEAGKKQSIARARNEGDSVFSSYMRPVLCLTMCLEFKENTEKLERAPVEGCQGAVAARAHNSQGAAERGG